MIGIIKRSTKQAGKFVVETDQFVHGNYMNACTVCGGQFYNTNKMWFLCPIHSIFEFPIIEIQADYGKENLGKTVIFDSIKGYKDMAGGYYRWPDNMIIPEGMKDWWEKAECNIAFIDMSPILPSNAANYHHVIMYRKCNTCEYKGEDLSFPIKSIIKEQTENTCTSISSNHCPKCDSTDLSPCYWDEELTQEYKLPTVYTPPNDKT